MDNFETATSLLARQYLIGDVYVSEIRAKQLIGELLAELDRERLTLININKELQKHLWALSSEEAK